MTARLPRPVVVAGAAAGAGLVLLAAGRTWVTVTLPATANATGRTVVTADGRTVAPGAVALALVCLVGGLVLVAVGRRLRTVVALLLVLAGVGVVAASLPAWADPLAAAEPAVAAATGTLHGATSGVTAAVGVWPALSAVGGAVAACAALGALMSGRAWHEPSRRFERPGAASGAGASSDGGAADGAQAADGAHVLQVPDGQAGAGPAATHDDRLDAWDRLTRGEDPTD